MSSGFDDLLEAGHDATPEPGSTRRQSDSKDRRDGDRRQSIRGRRSKDRKTEADVRNLGWIGAVIAAAAALIAFVAYVKAPVRYTASPECASDGFSGQVQAHRGLSMLWAVVMALLTLALAIPNAKRRPVAIMMFCGLSLGLLAGALLRVDTWLIGYCFS